MQERNRIIIRTSIIGVLTNIFLAAFKAFIGIISHSIAVVLDAVNNLSDALSSVITIVGTKLASKAPDKKHPLGHGRVEYISAMLVSAIILYAGITSLVESIKKIITPVTPDYSSMSLIIIAVAIVVKLLLGRFVKDQGEKANSSALVASGQDASFDAILSASVLASAIVFLFFGVSLEAYIGVIISVFIIKAGSEILRETVNDVLGKRADPELTKRIKQLITEEPEVGGAYDLVITDYGPGKNLGSVHIELPDTMTVKQLDTLTRRIETKVYKETGVALVGIGVYSHNTENDAASEIRTCVQRIVSEYDWAIQMHGFYVDTERQDMRFDVVIRFGENISDCINNITKRILSEYPGYSIEITPDIDISD